MKKNKNRVWRFLYKLHRYIGLISAIVLIMLSITGIALNHTEDLNLDSEMLQSNLILDWYGIKAPSQFNSFNTRNNWLSQIKQSIYFNKSVLLNSEQQLLGAVETDDYIVAALNHSLVLISLEGELIEQSQINSIEKIGLIQQQAIIKTATETLISDDGLISWHTYHKNSNIKETIQWSTSTQAPTSIITTIKHGFRSSIVPMERVILDLHSGRFFGWIGIMIVDISGIFLIILSLSGCTIWIKHKFRKRSR